MEFCIGCGSVGYSETDIAPMFVNALINYHLPNLWREQ